MKKMKNEVTAPKGIEKFFTEKTVFTILKCTAIFFLLSVIIYIIYGNWQFSRYLDEEKIGQFGDFIGAIIGSIIALLGVMLYYIALKEQRKEIAISKQALNLQIDTLKQQIKEFEAQRKELEQTRNVYEEQTKVYKQQSQIMKIQQFESNFYSFLNVFLKIKTLSNEIFDNVIKNMMQFIDILKTEENLKCHNIVCNEYNKCYTSKRSTLSIYFKTVFHLLNIIDNSNLRENEKEVYANTFKSQMDENDLLIMYYYCHSFYGINFQTLIIKYNILEHLHPLTKFEFKSKYYLEDNTELFIFIEELSILIDKNIAIATSLVSDPVSVSKNYPLYGIILSFDINLDFYFSIQYKHTEGIRFPFQDKFKDFIKHLLYDKFFYSKFIIPKGDEIEFIESKINNNTVFSYLIKSNNIK